MIWRYGSARDDFDGRTENYPCIIVIQLSKGRNEYEDDKRNKKYERIPIYTSESDYIEDNDESKMLDVNNRNVQIQVKNEKLVIIVICLISFYDLWNNIYFFFTILDDQKRKSKIAYQNIKIG